jgi:riboflavin biosynthesis pyrimidine reductase
MTPQPLGAIVTASGRLPREHPYFQSPAVVYVLSDAAVDVPAEVVRLRSVSEVLQDLARRGAQRVLCEGGPRLNAALLDAGLVDELYFTLAPKLVGGEDPLTLVVGGSFPTVHLRLIAVEQHDSELFLRYAVQPKG